MVRLALAFLVTAACNQTSSKLSAAAERQLETREGARSRAEEFVGALRNAEWDRAARFVYLDSNTRTRMGIASGADVQEARPKIEAWFKMMYGMVRPGKLVSVKIDPSDPAHALVSYVHEDLDGFTMHFVDGDWFYVLD
jgi:hypothetical protein